MSALASLKVALTSLISAIDRPPREHREQRLGQLRTARRKWYDLRRSDVLLIRRSIMPRGLTDRTLVGTCATVAGIVALANGAHAIRGGIRHWLTVPSARWVESPSNYLGTWAVIAVAATVTTALLTSGVMLARRKNLIEVVILSVPVALFLSQLPLYWYIRRGLPSSWYVCPNEREAYAAPLAVMVGLAFYAILTRLRSARAGA